MVLAARELDGLHQSTLGVVVEADGPLIISKPNHIVNYIGIVLANELEAQLRLHEIVDVVVILSSYLVVLLLEVQIRDQLTRHVQAVVLSQSRHEAIHGALVVFFILFALGLLYLELEALAEEALGKATFGRGTLWHGAAYLHYVLNLLYGVLFNLIGLDVDVVDKFFQLRFEPLLRFIQKMNPVG